MGYRRVGMGAANINPTTIWTPQGGFTGGGGGGAAYVAPATIATPECSKDTRPGGAAFSDACIAQVLGTQQQNMQLNNNANYNVDLANCLNTYPQPPDCYSRTFGLTPTGGYTSDAGGGPKGSQAIVDANGNIVSNPPPVYVASGTPNPYVAPTAPISKPPAPIIPPTPATQSAAPPGGTALPPSGGSGSGGQAVNDTLSGGYVSSATDFLTGNTAVAGFTIPMWGWLAAGAAALLLLRGGR